MSPREPVEPTPRRAMTKKRRVEVALKSDGRCARCGDKLKADFEADHIISLFLGGADEIENLEALCYDCHRRGKTPEDAAKHGKVRRLIKKADPTMRKPSRMQSRPFQKTTEKKPWPKRPNAWRKDK